MKNLIRLHLEGLKNLTKNSLEAIFNSNNFSPIFDIELILKIFREEHPLEITDNELIMLGASSARYLRNVSFLNLAYLVNVGSFGVMSLIASDDICYVEIMDLSGTKIDDPAIFAIS